MDILVVNRHIIEAGLDVVGLDGSINQMPPHMVISVTDPDKSCADINTGDSLKALLRLQFWDIDNIAAFEDDPRYESLKRHLFEEADAVRIVNFVRKYLHKIELIICHCEAGRSRSAAIAATLSRVLNGDDKRFFSNPYHPNFRVYSKTLRHWYLSDPKLMQEQK